MLDVERLKTRYLKIRKKDGIKKQDLAYIEDVLEVKLPEDFKKISTFYNGGCLSIIDHYCFKEGKANNIIEETRRLRAAVNLPKHFIVLAEPSESLIVMDVLHKPSIIWCDAFEVYNLENQSYDIAPDVWEDYSDFFSELLSVEEEETICKKE